MKMHLAKILCIAVGLAALCPTARAQQADSAKKVVRYTHQPLISSMYTADPSAHVFNGKIYIYPSHDINTGKPNTNGDHFDMQDYHILSLDKVGARVKDHGVALRLSDVAWAERQLWAPDVAFKSGKYYLYFPARDREGIFRTGVATSKSPSGPFVAEKNYIAGSFSIDPAVFQEKDQTTYMYFGGLWGGQLQKWTNGSYNANEERKDVRKADEPALGPKVARLDAGMLKFAEAPKEILILDEHGKPLLTGDHERRFFEGAWVFKFKETYYFTYSTGDTHKIVYATGNSPYGPFNYQGIILKPVSGWTTHHSILEFEGKWYIFYHDTQLSGKNHLRNIKMAPLEISADGKISTLDPFKS